jgi:hypothetical protein
MDHRGLEDAGLDTDYRKKEGLIRCVDQASHYSENPTELAVRTYL